MRMSLTGRAAAVVTLAVVLGAAACLVLVALAGYGVTSTLTWLHVTGHMTDVVVDRCADLGRNGRSCVGHTVGPGSSTQVLGLPYDLSSTGRTVRVWSSGGTAVVGTPWGALWFDVLLVVLLGTGAARLARRRSTRRGAARSVSAAETS